MNANDLQPAGNFARNYGVKCVVYGAPGTGKTPIIGTCPRPVLLATEPGLLSMRGSKVPTWLAPTTLKIDEFFRWFELSAEAKAFDTLCIDSTSQMADIALQEAKKKNAHGLKQYGDMLEYIDPIMRRMYFLENKHMYFIAKEETTGAGMRKPFYPGNALPIAVSHLFDVIIRVAKVPIPGVGERTAFQCNGTFDVMARNRTGNLADFEPPDFNLLVQKCMAAA